MTKWIDHLYELTPVHFKAGMHFKRDDFFAPKGYGHINGAKLRQALYLVDKWVKEENIKGIVSGSVSQSPQHAFISELCKQYGLDCLIVHSKKDFSDSPYLRLAEKNGARFIRSKVGYSQTLGAIARKQLANLDNYRFLETNITLDESCNDWDAIKDFHRIGAEQVKNIPNDIDTLIIPCGSCNSVTSIFYGLHLFPKNNIKNIYLFGIGNNGSNNIHYVENRIENITDIKCVRCSYDFSFTSAKRSKHKLHHINLNGTGFCKYSDTMPEGISDIMFHPRYEGKCIRYIKKNMPELWREKSLFWIVGGELSRVL